MQEIMDMLQLPSRYRAMPTYMPIPRDREPGRQPWYSLNPLTGLARGNPYLKEVPGTWLQVKVNMSTYTRNPPPSPFPFQPNRHYPWGSILWKLPLTPCCVTRGRVSRYEKPFPRIYP